MERLNRVLTTAAIVGFVCATGTAAPAAVQSGGRPESQTVRLLKGSITGTVSDEHGGPLAGAMVSALGVTMAMTVSDAGGRFSLDALPTGRYVLQAHLSGFDGSRRETVEVNGTGTAVSRLLLRRRDTPVATTGISTPVAARPIVAAGFVLPATTLQDEPENGASAGTDDKHAHTETAWRLRHIKRSVLKSSSPVVTLAEDDAELPEESPFGRDAYGAAAARGSSSFFADLPFSGEVNLLTSSAMAPGELFPHDFLPRGVAYLSIGAPTPAGDWSVRAAMSQGDLSSWIIAGDFESRQEVPHQYRFGLSYGTQEYIGGNPAALAAVTDGSRNVGELFAFDQWRIGPMVNVEYGGRYARYDYLENRGQLSPRLTLNLQPFEKMRVNATIEQRMVAPGAEEFLSSELPGPWLPPERTFSPLGAPGETDGFHVERARSLSIAVEHEFEDTYVVGVRRYYQDVDNQLVTLFGLAVPDGPQSVGHYYVASAGAVDAEGWAVRISSPPGRRLRGSVDYSVTRARWLTRGDADEISAWAPAAVRPASEDLHDVTTSFETEIPETATRVFVLYRINSGFTRSNTELARPGFDARFDVQVTQALPFGVAGTRWEILVGVRNLFRDPQDPASVYDELLVLRPPKRVVGGFLVRF
jgi:hypothetical protein